MSAPNTDVEKQEKRHRTPLGLGIGATIAWAAVLLLGLLLFIAFQGNDPGDGQADGSGDTASGGESAPAESDVSNSPTEGEPAPAAETPSEQAAEDSSTALGNEENPAEDQNE